MITSTSYEKEVSKIMKKYGDWIAQIHQQPNVIDIQRISTVSIEDLVKLSEELGKPILHFISADKPSKHTFYVIDGSIVYEFFMNDEGGKKIVLKNNKNK